MTSGTRYIISADSIVKIRSGAMDLYRDCVHTPGSENSFNSIVDTLRKVTGGYDAE